MRAIVPALFTFDGVHIVATHLNGSMVGPPTLYPGSSTPAAHGEQIVVYASGFGLPYGSTTTAGSATQSGSYFAFAGLRRRIKQCNRGVRGIGLARAGSAIASVKEIADAFKGVGPGGADIYEVKFAHGSMEWRIMMESDVTVAGVGFRAQ
jgi:hypothetical protein